MWKVPSSLMKLGAMSFPFFFFNSAWKDRDYAIYQRVSDRVATWTWTSVIQVECLRGWLFWLTVTLDFFGHQFLEPDLLTSKQLLDLCLAYVICSCLWKLWWEICAYRTISLKNEQVGGRGILLVRTAVVNSSRFLSRHYVVRVQLKQLLVLN